MKSKSVDFSILLASSAHDMKNSLGMIVQTVDNLTEMSPRNEEEAKLLSVLHYEALRVNNDLIRLLGIYRMQEKCMPICIDEYSVQDLLEEQQIKISHLLASENITLHIDCDESLNWNFDCDLISSIINNVLVNTIRYTEDRIKLTARVENDQLLITVEDNGSGFPNDMIGNPQTQTKAVNFNTGNTGLGLYFSSKVANLHQHNGKTGNIYLDNGGKFGGAVFSLSLP